MSSNILTKDEIKNLVYNPNTKESKNSETPNLEKFEKVENPKFPFFSRSIPKLLIVALISAPVFSAIWFITSGWGSSPETAAQVLSGSSDSQLEKDNELLREQLDDLQVQNAMLQQDFEELQTKKDKVKIVKVKPKPKPVKVARAETIVEEPSTEFDTAPQTIPETVEPIDPYAEWNRHAVVGMTVGEGFPESETPKPKAKATSTANAFKSSESSPTKDRPNSQVLAKLDTDNSISTASDSIPQVSVGNSIEDWENNSEDTEGLSQEAQNLLVSDTFDTSFLDAKRREYERQDAAGLNSSLSESGETFLETKRREYQEQDAADSSSILPESGETFLETKRREYQKQDAADSSSILPESSETFNQAQRGEDRQQYPTTLNSASNIKFGSQVMGELSQSISWVSGRQPQLRGIINLSEALLAEDDSVALPANSSIIVQVDSKRNGLVELQAIAISYENEQGQLIQQPIPPDTFLIQNENNSPLIISEDRANDGELPGEDELLEFLGRDARKIRNIVDDLNQSRNLSPDTFELSEGTKLTITVNSFLQINR